MTWLKSTTLPALLALLFLIASGVRHTQKPLPVTPVAGKMAASGLPLWFEELPSIDGEPVFTAGGAGHRVWLRPQETVLSLQSPACEPAKHRHGSQERSVLRTRLRGANPHPRLRGTDRLAGRANYFLGNDPAKWRTNCATYAKVQYDSVYPGIDLVYYGRQGELEYDFVVKPGADPGRIHFEVAGAERVQLDHNGDLLLTTSGGEARQRKPVVYQQVGGIRREVSGAYRVASNGEVGFQLSAYDPTLPLVIDPVLAFATYFGSSVGDGLYSVGIGSDGSIYVGGATAARDFPVTVGAFQRSYAGGADDAIIAKLNPAGNSLAYVTYLGGAPKQPFNSTPGTDEVVGLGVCADGSVCVGGATSSYNFPTVNAIQATFQGGRDYGSSYDGFVTRLSPGGDSLIYSTYLGSSKGYDQVHGVIVGADGSAYVAGETEGGSFPITPGVYSPTTPANLNGFVSKIAANGTLTYSTFLPYAAAFGLAVDPSGAAYVTGVALSSLVPTTPGAFQTTYHGSNDAFVMKLAPDASALVYGTLLGGSKKDIPRGITVDSDGDAYVIGDTLSPDFPIANALQATNHLGDRDAFITELNPSGSGLVFSTFLGGTGTERGWAAAIDPSGNIFVSGATESTDFPITADALQNHPGGLRDVFLMELAPGGTSVLYSTYFGGSGNDGGSGEGGFGSFLALAPSGDVVLVGTTSSKDFPVSNAVQPLYGGDNNDGYIVRLVWYAPAAPQNLKSSYAAGKINLTWDDKSLNESGFEVERDAGSGFTLIAGVGANSTSYADANVSADHSYTYRVRAINAVGPSSYTGPASVSTLPGAPTSLTAATLSSSRIDLSWTDASATETGFEIERKNGSGPYALVTATAANTTSYSNTGLEPGTTYTYRVTAINDSGESAPSNEASATTLATPPAAPSGLKATALSSSQIKLEWTDNSGNEDGFRLERKNGGGEFQQVATAVVDQTTYTDTGLAPNTTYTYQVLAFNAGGVSSYAGPASATTFDLPPAAPDHLTAVASAGSVTLTWQDQSSNESGFRIERKAPGGDFTSLDTAAWNATTYTDATVAANTQYAYRVRAYNDFGDSANAEVSVLTLPTAPSGLAVTVQSSSRLDLAWTDTNPSPAAAKIERSSDGGSTWMQIAAPGSGTVTYSDTGLAANTSYSYRVRSTNAAGDSDPSSTANGLTLPAAPDQLQTSAVTNARVDLTWRDNNANPAATKVERSDDGGTSYAVLATVSAGMQTYSDSTVTAGATYRYRVRSTNGSGDSEPSAELVVQVLPNAPRAPTQLTATAVTQTTISLSWTAPPGPVSGYQLERSADGGATYQQVAAPGASDTAATDTGLTAATTYAYRIRAVNAGGAGVFSDAIRVTTLPNPPAVPTDLAVTAVTQTTVSLSWTAPMGPLAGYELQRSADQGGSFQRIARPGAGDTASTDTSLSAATAYQYRIRALNAGGAGPYSSVVSATTLPNAPGAPVNFKATIGGASEIDLSWQEGGGTEHFVLERAAGSGSYQTLGTLGAGTLSYEDKALLAGTAYRYRIKATNAGGESPYATADATIPTGGKLTIKGTLAFGTIKGNTLKTRSITLSNRGTGPLVITIGTLAAPFKVASAVGTKTLEPKKALVVTVQFAPSAAGRFSAPLSIHSTDAGAATSITATGVAR